MKRGEKRAALNDLYHPFPEATQVCAKRNHQGLQFLPLGKVATWRVHSVPSCAGHCARGPLPPRPTQNTEGIGAPDCSDDSHEQREGVRHTANGAQDSTKGYGFQLTDPTKGPALKLIQLITRKPSQPAHVPPALHAPPPSVAGVTCFPTDGAQVSAGRAKRTRRTVLGKTAEAFSTLPGLEKWREGPQS